jgi:hypothetical protein
MKINWKKDILDYFLVRLIAIIYGLFLFSFGCLYLYGDIVRGVEIFSLSKFGVSATGVGAIIIFSVVKKQIEKMNEK